MNDLTDATAPKSKSQLKREMTALQDVGRALVQLSRHQLSKIAMDDNLRTAILHAQTITSRSAQRRQLQYIGRLMREVDVEPLQKALASLENQNQEITAAHHRLEKWRDRLIAEGDAALTEFCNSYPTADSQHLRQLIRKAQQEQKTEKPPLAARLIFRYIREL